MTNIQQEVTNFIEQDVSLRRGLARGLLNTRALAIYIYKNLNLNCTLDAVISAIRRYETFNEPKEDIKKRYKLIASAKVSSRTRMVSVLLKKENEVRSAITKLYSKIDFPKGEVIRILEVSQFIKLIIDESNFPEIEKLFPKKDIISVEKKLGEISLVYADEVANTPGVFAALSSELALSGVSIIDGMICGNEHIFIVNEDNLMKALQAMHRISKWGEKNK
jgi:predicted regulator of amino acid metabolism with ACT domain